MFNKKLLLSISALSLLSSAAYATAPNPCCFCPHFFVGIESGRSHSSEAYFIPQFRIDGINLTIPENTDWSRDFGSSPLYGAFVGYQFTPNIGLQLTFDHRNEFTWTVPVSSASSFPDSPFEEYSAHDIESSTLFVDLKLAPSVCWNGFVPFVKAGLGLSRNKSGEVRDVYVPNAFFDTDLLFDLRLEGDTETEFAWNAGVGVDYYFNKCLSANISYRYVSIGEFKTKDHGADLAINDDDVETSGFKSEHMFLSEVLVGLTYHFG